MDVLLLLVAHLVGVAIGTSTEHDRSSTRRRVLDYVRLRLPWPSFVENEKSEIANENKPTIVSKNPVVKVFDNFFSSDEVELMKELSRMKKGRSKYFPKEFDSFMNLIVDLRTLTGKNSLTKLTKGLEGLRFDITINKKQALEISELIETWDSDESLRNKTSLESYLKESYTKFVEEEQPSNVPHVKVSKIWHDEDELLAFEDLFTDFHARLASITGFPEEVVKQTEPIQVLHYNGFINRSCHYSTDPYTVDKPCCVQGEVNCQICRFLTLAFFLDDVENGGELTFPAETVSDTENYSQPNDHMAFCDGSGTELRIVPKAGRLVMWYNYDMDDEQRWVARRNSRALTYIQPLHGEMSVAYFHISFSGDGEKEFRHWRTGTNFLSEVNFNTHLVEHMLHRQVGTAGNASSPPDMSNIDTSENEEEQWEEDGHDRTQVKNKNVFLSLLPEKSAKILRRFPEDMLENKFLQSVLLLLEALPKQDLESIATSLHGRLDLGCYPLIINPNAD